MAIGAKIIFLIIGIIGFILALYVRQKKQETGSIVCPIVGDCAPVLRSKYGVFMGLDTTTWGAFYYVLVVAFSILILVFPSLVTPLSLFIFIAISFFAFLFSLYLFGVQAFVIKHWCSWCLTSGVISFVIFVLSLTAPALPTFAIFNHSSTILVGVYGAALAVGLGSVVISDIFLFRFLRDYRISSKEASVIHIITDVVWGALGVLIVSGIALIVASRGLLLYIPQALLLLLVVGVLVVVSVLLHRIWFHRIVDISLGEKSVEYAGQLHDLRRIAYAFTTTSLVSWVSILLLSIVNFKVSFGWLFFGYFMLVLIGVIISQYVDWKFVQKRYHSS